MTNTQILSILSEKATAASINGKHEAAQWINEARETIRLAMERFDEEERKSWGPLIPLKNKAGCAVTYFQRREVSSLTSRPK